MERIAAELGRKFKVKSMVEAFGADKAIRTLDFSGVTTLFKADGSQTPEEKGYIFHVPIPGDRGGTRVDSNDDTSHIMCVVRTVARFCGNPGPTHNNRMR